MVDRQHSRPTGRDPKSTRGGRQANGVAGAPLQESGSWLTIPSYLKDTLTFARYASTLPSLSCISNSDTSATLKSRNVLLARLIAAEAAFSQDSVLVPISSMIL